MGNNFKISGMPAFLDIGENYLEYYKDVLEDNYTY